VVAWVELLLEIGGSSLEWAFDLWGGREDDEKNTGDAPTPVPGPDYVERPTDRPPGQ